MEMSGLFHEILFYFIFYILYIFTINIRFTTIPMRIIIKIIHHDGWPGILSTVKWLG